MATRILAPARFDASRHIGHTVFLSGGMTPNWRYDVWRQLTDTPNVVVFDPTLADFGEATERRQIEWELDHMEQAECVFAWFPKDAKAPVSFLEAGLYLRTGRLLIGAEHGFYRRANLELTCRRYGLSIYPTIEAMVARLRVWLNALEVARV